MAMVSTSRGRRPPPGQRLARQHAKPAFAGQHRSETSPKRLARRHRARRSHNASGAARPLLIVSLVTLAGVFLGPGTGWAYWTAMATGEGTAATGTMLPPTDVTASVAEDPGTVVVSWTAAVAPGGEPEQGYYLTRTRESDSTTAAACGTSPAAPTTTLTCQDQPQPDDDYHYVVTAVHHTWTAASSPSNTVNVDTLAPTAPSAPQLTTASDTGGSSTDRVTDDSTPTFTGTAEPGSMVTVYAGGTAVGTGIATAGTYSITTTSVLVEGSQTITAEATDGAGNTGPASPGTQVTIDTLRPAVTVDQQAEQVDPTNSEPINFAVVFSEPVTGFTEDDVNLTAPAGATALVTGTGATYNVAVTGMTTDGTVTIWVGTDAAYDLAGNGNAASTSTDNSVTRDTTAPAAPSAPTLTAASDSGTSDSDRITNVTTPTFTGTAEAGVTVTLYSGGVPVGTGVATGGSYAIATTSLAEGTPTITATATDAAGNPSDPSTGTTVTIDTTAPAAPSTPDLTAGSDSWSPQAAGTTDTDNTTNDTTPTFTGTAEADSTVTLYSDGTFIMSGVAGGGSYSITAGTLAQGAQAITATASDAAGNTGPASAGVMVTIDSIAPTATISDVTYSNGWVTTTGTAGIDVGDAGSVTVVICSQDFPCSSGNTDYSGTATVNQTTGGWTNTSSNLESCIQSICSGPGQIYVQATQTDHAGNIGTSSTVSRNYS